MNDNVSGFNLSKFIKPETLGRTLNSISRGLTIANKAIPLYGQIKPVISIFKKTNNDTSTKKNKTIEKNKPTTINSSLNGPSFFA